MRRSRILADRIRASIMPKLLILTALTLLLAHNCFAQEPSPMQCQLIRVAVAQYGYAAARQHALKTYGPEAVKVGDKCLAKQPERPQHFRGFASGATRD